MRPQKRFGQNFLTDRNIARKIVSAIGTFESRLIIEIGPGKGILTDLILEKADQYIGVEIDPALANYLQDRFSKHPGFTLITKDFLELDLKKLLRKYPGFLRTIIGNIPYNITSPILFKLFDSADHLDEGIIMVQKEVGERIVAKEGGKDYGLLSIFSQLFADADLLFNVPAQRFYPRPKVDSTVIRFRFLKKVKEQFADFEMFQRLVRTCFQQRRKMLRNSLRHLYSAEVLSKLDISLSQRPEQLSIREWKELFHRLYINTAKGKHS